MNEYNVRIRVHVTYYVDPKRCPSIWRGSGVYSVEEQEEYDYMMFVYAKSEEKARDLVKKYEFKGHPGFESWRDIVSLETVKENLDDEDFPHEEVQEIVLL